jgi:hypothetical protein
LWQLGEMIVSVLRALLLCSQKSSWET